ncbi:MAG: type II toxin-antitoxin system PemK/MazF family toxin [Nitrososphaerales archaeon]
MVLQGRRYLEQILGKGQKTKMISQRDIVLLKFPFSDLKSSKIRPALVLSNDDYNSRFEDFVAVPLTTNLQLREYTILITSNELETGRLIAESKVKVDRIFSVSKKLVRIKIGRLKQETYARIKSMLLDLIE